MDDKAFDNRSKVNVLQEQLQRARIELDRMGVSTNVLAQDFKDLQVPKQRARTADRRKRPSAAARLRNQAAEASQVLLSDQDGSKRHLGLTMAE